MTVRLRAGSHSGDRCQWPDGNDPGRWDLGYNGKGRGPTDTLLNLPFGMAFIELREVSIADSCNERDRRLSSAVPVYKGDTVDLCSLGGDDVFRFAEQGRPLATYLYAALGQLREVDLADGTIVTYDVDALGRRVSRSVDGSVTHRYLWSRARLVAEVDSSGEVTSRYIYASSGTVPDLLIRDGTTYQLLHDNLDSVRLVVNTGTGTVALRHDYDEWGRLLSSSGTLDLPFGYAGGLTDPLTGLVRFGARDYNPEIGRWTAKDPILFDGGDSVLYGYVGGNPVNRVDPSGLSGFWSTVGKVWASTTSVLGLVVGGVGLVMGGEAPTVGTNAIEFKGNRFVGQFTPAVTLGNVICYADIDPSDSLRDHETQHTYQAEVLGGLYLPAHFLAQVRGFAGSFIDNSQSYAGINDRVHSPYNFLESGPMSFPPRPW